MYFCLSLPYAVFGSNMDLAARVIPSLLVTALLPLCLYPELLLLLARYFRSLHDSGAVEHICNHALDLVPGDCNILLDQHDALMAQKRYAEAKIYSDRAASVAPKRWGPWYRSALVAMWLDDYASAAIDIEKALELAPGNPYCLVVRAAIRESQDDWQGCLADCAGIDPASNLAGRVRMITSRVYLQTADFQAAKDIMSKVPKRIKAGSVDAVALAHFKFSQNQYSEVVNICSQVSDDHSAAYWFLDIQASSFRHLNEGALALKSISRSIAMKPERTHGYEGKALVLADAGLLNQALVGCKRSEILGKKKSSRRAEAYVRFRRGEFEEMLECTQEAVLSSPNSAYVHALNSIALAGSGRLDEAKEEAIKATELHSLEALAWYALADIHIKQDQFEEAIKSLDTGLAADPHYRFSYQLRAEAHRRAGYELEADKDQSKFDQLQAQFMANLEST